MKMVLVPIFRVTYEQEEMERKASSFSFDDAGDSNKTRKRAVCQSS